MSIIEVHQLRKDYGPVVAVTEASFTVEAGEIFGILGPNGAGKTTIVECVTGMLGRTSGSILVFDHDPGLGDSTLRAMIGYQLQSSAFPARLRVIEALELFASFYPSPVATDQLLDTVGLSHRRRAFFDQLSGGERQRLSIAVALVGDPQIAVLDELTTGLDPQGRRDMWQLVERVRSTGVTVVLVSHFLDEVERLCDRLVVINHGRSIFTGTPSELINTPADRTGSVTTLEDAYLHLIDTDAPTPTRWDAA